MPAQPTCRRCSTDLTADNRSGSELLCKPCKNAITLAEYHQKKNKPRSDQLSLQMLRLPMTGRRSNHQQPTTEPCNEE